MPEFSANGAGVGEGDAGDEEALLACGKFGRDGGDLSGSLAFAVDDFGEILAQGAMEVHLGEPEIGNGRGLERPHDFLARDLTGAKCLEQRIGFRGRHGGKMPIEGDLKMQIEVA